MTPKLTPYQRKRSLKHKLRRKRRRNNELKSNSIEINGPMLSKKSWRIKSGMKKNKKQRQKRNGNVSKVISLTSNV